VRAYGPALGSGVIVTPFADVLGFFSFLGSYTPLLDERAWPEDRGRRRTVEKPGCG
jgi:hypothetical protein